MHWWAPGATFVLVDDDAVENGQESEAELNYVREMEEGREQREEFEEGALAREELAEGGDVNAVAAEQAEGESHDRNLNHEPPELEGLINGLEEDEDNAYRWGARKERKSMES